MIESVNNGTLGIKVWSYNSLRFIQLMIESHQELARSHKRPKILLKYVKERQKPRIICTRNGRQLPREMKTYPFSYKKSKQS